LWRTFREVFHDRKRTATYDIFVAFTHKFPPFCSARTAVLIVLFPDGTKPVSSAGAGLPVRQRMIEALAHWFWNKRMTSYRFSLANSEFTREWTRTYWGVECGILHPPCRMINSPASKDDIILNAARFSPGKRQAALMKAYGLLEPDIPQSWRYRSVGILAPDDADYFREVAALAAGRRAELRTDLPRELLDEEFRRAAIFWHGTGENGGEELPPVYAEHFGITTVEAMSAGCVPVVNNNGGQREIVEHGISGFLWNTIEELLSHTRELIADNVLRARMADAARLRARSFSQESFVKRFKEVLAPAVELD